MYKISPTIDSKVCNKKVAVDDKAPKEVRRDDRDPEEPTAKPQNWSCVDYVDVNVTRDVGAENRRDPKAPEKGSDGLQRRFGELAGNDKHMADTKGECRKIALRGNAATGRGEECHSGGQASASMVLVDAGTGVRKQEVTEVWWEKKQTNQGWPGTAEGKINTAQGMAGDLVSNLESEEKSAVAGILTRTISGGEVVEVTAVTTTSVMANACCPPKPTHVATFTPLPLGRKPCILKLIACKYNTYLDAAKRKSRPCL